MSFVALELYALSGELILTLALVAGLLQQIAGTAEARAVAE